MHTLTCMMLERHLVRQYQRNGINDFYLSFTIYIPMFYIVFDAPAKQIFHLAHFSKCSERKKRCASWRTEAVTPKRKYLCGFCFRWIFYLVFFRFSYIFFVSDDLAWNERNDCNFISLKWAALLRRKSCQKWIKKTCK